MEVLFVINILTKFYFDVFKISMVILWYLEAKFDYDYVLLFFSLGSYNSTQEVSSHFEQNWVVGGSFCDSYVNVTLKA